MFALGDVEGSQRGIEVKMQAVGVSCLAIAESGKLFGVAKNKLDLEADFVVAIDGPGIQRQVGGKEQA